jgi:hypothetical protein
MMQYVFDTDNLCFLTEIEHENWLCWPVSRQVPQPCPLHKNLLCQRLKHAVQNNLLIMNGHSLPGPTIPWKSSHSLPWDSILFVLTLVDFSGCWFLHATLLIEFLYSNGRSFTNLYICPVISAMISLLAPLWKLYLWFIRHNHVIRIPMSNSFKLFWFILLTSQQICKFSKIYTLYRWKRWKFKILMIDWLFTVLRPAHE